MAFVHVKILTPKKLAVHASKFVPEIIGKSPKSLKSIPGPLGPGFALLKGCMSKGRSR